MCNSEFQIMETNETCKLFNDSISFLNITHENEFFKELYSNTALKQCTVTIFFFGLIFGLLLEFGIIWYEKFGNHPYRTTINQLFSTVSWFVISYILFVYIPDGVRYLIGPLNSTFCDVHNFLKNYIFTCILLTLDCIILLRYIFVFKLSNFAIINDDLITVFLQISILTVGFWMAGGKRFSVGKMPLDYYMCSGTNPPQETDENGYGKVFKKFDSVVILMSISFLLNTFVFVKIFLFQRKAEKATRQIEIGRINTPENENQGNRAARQNNQKNQSRNVQKSMADLTTQVFCLTFTTLAVVIHVIINHLEPKQLNDYENRWLVYFIQIIGVAVTILGTSFQYYLKNRTILNVIWRSISNN